jgi:hypothetical protein
LDEAVGKVLKITSSRDTMVKKNKKNSDGWAHEKILNI